MGIILALVAYMDKVLRHEILKSFCLLSNIKDNCFTNCLDDPTNTTFEEDRILHPFIWPCDKLTCSWVQFCRDWEWSL